MSNERRKALKVGGTAQSDWNPLIKHTKKRVSKRRWKARLWRGDWVPWSAIVEHGLEKAYRYERSYERMTARLDFQMRTFTTTRFYPISYFSEGGTVAFTGTNDIERWL